MPSINDDEFFNFNGFAAKSKDKSETAALEELQDCMGEVVSHLEHQVRTTVHRAETIFGLSRAEAYRSAIAAIKSNQGHELSSPDATQPPQALEGDIIDPQVANLEAEVSRLRTEKDAAEEAWNLRDSNRLLQLSQKDAEITRLSNLLNTALRNLGTPPATAPTPGPAPAEPTPAPPHYGRPATPAPATPEPPTAAPDQPVTPAEPAPAEPAASTSPAAPAASTQQTPPQEASSQRPAGNPGPAASNPNQASTPPTRTMPAQSQRQPRQPRQQRQERQGVRGWVGNVLFGPEPEEPNNRQSR